MSTELSLCSQTKGELQRKVTLSQDLTINGINDKEGYKKVHEVEMELKETRINISKTRKLFTDPKNKEIKDAIKLEKEYLEILEPAEAELKAKKKAINDEKAEIKEEERLEKQKALQIKIDELAKYNYSHNDVFELSQMSEMDYNYLVQEKKDEFEKIEAERIEKEKKEELEQKKNAVKSMILNANNLLDLLSADGFIKDHKLDFSEFENDLKNKKSMIEHEEEKKRFEDEKEKLAKEKLEIKQEKQEKAKKDELDRIDGLRREMMFCKNYEELEEFFTTQDEKDQVTLNFDYATIKSKITTEINEKKRVDTENAEKQKEDQAKLEKKKKYKDFLSKNEGKYDGFFDKDGKRTLYKIVDEFNL